MAIPKGEKQECPVYYTSRQMSPAERKYTTTEREALAVVYACKKFQHYLLGYRIVFRTDHDSLKYLSQQAGSLRTNRSLDPTAPRV